MSLKGTEIVEKSNALNEMRLVSLTLQELRFMSIYLSKINARDINTRKVIFPVTDFQKIMEIKRIDRRNIIPAFETLISKIAYESLPSGGVTVFPLFKKAKFDNNDIGEWFVEIEASDEASPLMFDLKEKYFKYELWNALRLKSANQIALYELLKQYENIGKLELSVDKLRQRLGIEKTLYRGRTGWSDFKKSVLDSGQQALKEATDISFIYEKGKTGVGGKWLTIVFRISKNTEYKGRITLAEFIKSHKFNTQEEFEELHREKYDETLYLLATACEFEFNNDEVQVIYDIIIKQVTFEKGQNIHQFDLTMHNYLKPKYNEFKAQASRTDVKNRFRYFRRMLLEGNFEN